MGVPTPRTAVDLGASVDLRLTLLERRLGVLPDRLQRSGQRVADWNDAVAVGFYWSNAFTPNAPVEGLQFVGEVLVHGQHGMVAQSVYQVNLTEPSKYAAGWRRFRDGAGVWTPWVSTGGYDTGWVNISSYLLSGFSGTIHARVKGDVVTISGIVGGSLPAASTTTDIMSPIPVEFRNTLGTMVGAAWQSGYSGSAVVREDGTVGIGQRTVDWSGCRFTMTYVSG